jgi:hypothetical protein
MRRVIRGLDTGLFFAHGKWTSEVSLAQEFPDQESIKSVVTEKQIQNAEMVFLSVQINRVSGGVRIRCHSTPKQALADKKPKRI